MKKMFLGLLMAVILSMSGYSQDTITIGGQTPTDSSKYVPLYSYYNYSYSQTLYTADEIGQVGTITSLSYYLKNLPSASYGKTISIKVYMAQTEQTSITTENYLQKSDLTLVYDGTLDLENKEGVWKEFILTTPFVLEEDNLVIAVEASMGNWFTAPSWGAYATASQCRYSNSDDNMPTSVDNYSSYSPAIKLAITTPTGPICYSVKKIQAYSDDSQSATVSWLEANGSTSYQYQLKLASQTWDDVTDADINTVTDTTVTITNLTANTYYDIRVRNVCSSDSYSSWKYSSFKTACDFLTEDNIPYIMNPSYEEKGTAKLPSCWTRLNTTNTNYPYLNTSGELYMYYNNAVALNGYTGDITALQLSFLTKPGNNTFPFGSLEVGIMTDLTDSSTYTSIKSLIASNMTTNWIKVEAPFDTYTLSDDVETYYVVIKHTEPNNDGYSWYLKDITLEHIPDCKVAENPQVTEIAAESATLTWTAGDETTDWTIYYWKDGDTDTLTADASDTTTILTNLEPQTEYNYYIVTDCEGYKPKTMVYSFETECSVVEVSNDSSFDVNFASNVDFSCWDKGNWYVIDYKGIITVSYANNDLILPTLDIENVTTPYLKIKHQNASTQIKILYRTSSSADWTTITTLEETNDTVTDLITLPNASSTYQIKITNTATSYANISELKVYNEENPPLCSKATNLNINASATSAVITWSQLDDASSWILYYKTDADESYTATETLSNPTYTLSVEPQTTYSFYVVTVCGEDASNYPTTNTKTFTTPCMGLILTDLPKTWDFESNNVAPNPQYSTYLLPDCWQRLGSNNVPYVKESSSYAHSGNASLYSSGSSTGGNFAILQSIDTTEIAMNNLQMSFYARSTSGYGGGTVSLSVGVMTDPTDKSTFTIIDSIPLTTLYKQYEVSFLSYQGQGTYIAMRMTGSSYAAAYIDDIILDTIPGCTKPQDLTVSNITTSSATLSWSQGGTVSIWNLYYKELGNDTAYTEITNIAETSYDLDLLDSRTYSVYVAAVCEDTILKTDSITFTTLCLPLTEDDPSYTMNFENVTDGELPICWTGLQMFTNPYSKYPSVNNNSFSAYEGNKFLRMYGNNSIALRGYQGDISALQISLWAKPNYNSASYGTLEIGVQTDLSDATTYQSVKVYNATEWTEDPEYKKLIVSFNIEADEDNTYYVIIKHTEPSPTGYFWYIDDLKLEIKPSCAEATNVTATNITGTTATISWTQPDETTSWTLYYKADTVEEYQSVVVYDDTTYEITDLTPLTNYSVYIQTNCTGNQPSTPIVTFRTDCSDEGITISEDYTYVEDFEGENGDFPECWLKLNTSSSSKTEIVVSPYSAQSNAGYLKINATGDTRQPIVILPKITNDLTTLRVQFYGKSESSANSGNLELGYMTDIADSTTFVALTSFSKALTNWTKHTVDLDEYTEQLSDVENPRLAFRHNDSTITYSYYYYALDSLAIMLQPSCKEPKNIIINPQATTASISWTSNASSFNISVTDEDNTEIATETNYTTTQYDLSELSPNTTYTISITGICLDNSLTPTTTTTFTTPCIALTELDLPYEMNFDSVTAGYNNLPSCWTKLLGKSNYPYVSNYYGAYSGSNVLSMYYNNTVTLQPYDGDISALQLSMYLKPAGTSMLYGSIEVGIQTNLLDTNTYTKIGEAMSTDWASSSWQKREFTFDTYQMSSSTNTYYVVIKHTEPYNSGYYWYIDDVKLSKIPACKQAQDLNITGISTDGATISWTQPGESVTSWIVRYKAIDSDTWQEQTTINADTTATLTNLTPATTYELVIESECSDAEQSNPISDTLTFTTSCSAITITDDNPYTQDFEFTEIREVPSCWVKVAETDNNTVTYLSGVSTESYIGGKGLSLKASPSCTRAIIALPEFTNNLSNLKVKFYAKSENETFSGNLELGYITEVMDSSTFVILTSFPDTATEWTLREVDLGTYATQLSSLTNARLAFAHNDTKTMSTWYDYAIDELEISLGTLIPDCQKPTNITTSNIAQTTATISWEGTASSYDIQLDNNEIENVTTTSKQFTGLTANTTYTVKVRSNCGTTTSDWVTTTFTTLENASNPCNKPTNLEVVPTSNSLTLSWTGDATAYDVQIDNETPQTTQQTTFTFTNLTHSTTYSLKVRSNCGDEVSDWATITATTLVDSSSLINIENSVNILTYPNPTTTNATLEINGLTEDANIILTDVNGRVVFKDIYSVNQSSITISTESLSAGVYYIRVTNANFTKTQTLIKK